MKKITWAQILKPWARKSGKNSLKPLSEEAKKYILDDIDLSANAFAFKYTPIDFNEELKKFAPSSSKGLDPTEDEEWREVPGYPDYMINRRGNIRKVGQTVDVLYWVTLWNGEKEGHFSTVELINRAFPPITPFSFTTDFADDFVDRLKAMTRAEMQAQNIVMASDGPQFSILICKHCNRQIERVQTSYLHVEGLNRGKQRCDPNDSQLVYGYNADPVGAECSDICLGHKAD